jgi:hypothetical protein
MRNYDVYYKYKDMRFCPKGLPPVGVVEGEMAINQFLRKETGSYPVVRLVHSSLEGENEIKVYQHVDTLQIKLVTHGRPAPEGDEYKEILHGTFSSLSTLNLVQAYMVKRELMNKTVMLQRVIQDIQGRSYWRNPYCVRAVFNGEDVKFLDPPDNTVIIG